MSIDGVSGPKGPKGPKRAQPTEAAQPVSRLNRPLAPEGIEGAEGAAPVQAADQIVLDAIQSVKADLDAGALGSTVEALKAVIDRIIATRYPGIPQSERRALNANLHMVLEDDPVVGDLIKSLLDGASPK